MWHETGHRDEVTCIVRSPNGNSFAVGYADGSIRLWDPSTSSVITTFNGHKKAITALAFDQAGTRLASGSQDTEIILWDIVGESGLYRYMFVAFTFTPLLTYHPVRLRGHRDQITSLHFLAIVEGQASTSTNTPGFLLTSSKDTFLKLWDLSTQHCIQTIVASHSEVWSTDVHHELNLIFTGSGEGELKAWKIDREALKDGLKETESGEVSLQLFFFSSYVLIVVGCENNSSPFKPPTLFETQNFSNSIPPLPTLPCSPVSRSFSGGIQDSVRGRCEEKASPTQEARQREGRARQNKKAKWTRRANNRVNQHGG